MSTARENHTATLLLDGRVLVTGGYGTQVQATAEIYDPGVQAFSLTGSMSAARTNHFAALLPSGKVLAAGGDGLSSAEVFDPAAGAWSGAGTLAEVRTRAAGAVLPDGRVLLTGGDEPASPSAEIYDPTANAWAAAAPMHTPRTLHTATLLANGRVLVAGGVVPKTGHDSTTKAVEIYDPVTDAWTPAAAMPVAVAQHTATLLLDGRVLVAGGTAMPGADSLTETAAAAIYDPVLDTWQSAPSMKTRRAGHTATRLPSGAVLVAGGLDASDSAQSSAELLPPPGGSGAAPWVALAPMERDRIFHTATALGDGTVLVAGGEQQSSAELFHTGKLGDPCSVGAQCQSGHCADGVCCDAACAAPCHTCALPSSLGTCSPAASGTDPRSECGDGGACDDTCGSAGACTSRVGTECSAGGCSQDGQGQLAPAACVAGNRDCPAAVTPCSGGYLCDADAGACRADCRSLADCALGYACDPSHRCVQPGDASGGDAPSCAHAAVPAGAGGTAALAIAAALLGAAARRSRSLRTRRIASRSRA
jgi:hypothetical protein